ncbi:uncharacterized protein KY384_007532 [Bacidia gigantensis]|uniref:uncharacterized protein n=1 Tax=Bacidia gigantensis TaxID=2732470 RepID=UPI001D05697B|nr:uncharacterized protein KY384_007532 [Bacidia gigantensis]KAG8527380.1 hypothetical protein KY384_007532 [Bacidia gigantensis]
MGTESARSTSPHETSFRADPIDAPICEPNAPFPELGWTQPSQSFRFDTAELVAIDDLLDAPGEESNALNSFQQAGTPRIKEEVHEDIEEIPRKPRDRTKEKASLQEPRIPTNFLWKALQETHIELDDSDDEDFDDLWASVRALNQQNNLQSTIQIDDQEKSDCLVIEDGQEKPIKSEPLESEAHGIFGPPPKCIVDDDGVVQILESDDEAPENTRSTLTKSMLRGANPRGQRTAEDVARLRQMQKYYIAAAQRNAKGNEEEPIEIADENAWMQQQTRMTEDKDATQAFMVLRRAYRTKCTKGKNTFEDDFEFGQAEKAHNERQRLLQIELDNDERNEDVESVDGLFFPSPSNKRGKDDQDIEPQEAIRRKHRPKDTDSRTKADFSKELTDNMMAGLPFILGNRNAELQEDGSVQPSKTKPSYKAKKKNIQQSANSNAKGKGKKKCGIAKGFLPPQKTGTSYQQKHLTGTQTLLTSDVFHDTNASANMEGMPVLRGSKKSDAMRDLLKGLDLTEEKQAISDKENILSMGRVLGGVRVADRASGWNMKGMSQVLRHHQIQGAGAMKKREIQEESPRGGILADVMG